MSMISELVATLRRYSQQAYNNHDNYISKDLKEAADTIEELAAKLAAANMERSSMYYNGGWIPCSKAVDIGYLQDWYINSVMDDEPVWTEAHIEELFNDFFLIPKFPPEPYKGVE